MEEDCRQQIARERSGEAVGQTPASLSYDGHVPAGQVYQFPCGGLPPHPARLFILQALFSVAVLRARRSIGAGIRLAAQLNQ